MSMSRIVTVMTFLSRGDQWVCKSDNDAAMVKEFFKMLKHVGELGKKLLAMDPEEWPFTKDDAEDLCICCLFLMGDEYIHIVGDVMGLRYAIRYMASLATRLITTAPDPMYKPSIMLDPRDTIDYGVATSEWCEDNSTSKDMIAEMSGFMYDCASCYLQQAKVRVDG